MWRSSFPVLKQGVTLAVARCNPASFRTLTRNDLVESSNGFCGCLFSTLGGGGGGTGSVGNGGDRPSVEEAKKLMRMVDVEALKMKLSTDHNEVVCYSDFLQACESMNIAKSIEEAKEIARVFDDAGVIFIFRDKVCLHPHKVIDQVRRAIPLSLMSDEDPRREELKNLQAKQDEIDVMARKQVRRILWAGLGLSLAQASLFFRLTFWEFSWDVMEPITFFTTSSGLILGYAYFLFTSRDPSYEDLMQRLFLSRRRKLIKKHNFDINRLKELQKTCTASHCSGGAGNSGSLS